MTKPETLAKLSDPALLDLVQRRTFGFFWDFAHSVSGLARDRTNSPADRVATGASGFGVMTIITAAERGWISRSAAVGRLRTMVDFLARADRHHGAFPHFMNGRTGATIPFGPRDDGGDLVETSFLFQGLLAARQYFSGKNAAETELRDAIEALWREVEWDWYARDRDVLTWHWSPNHGFAMDMAIRGWNECLITYVLAVASPTHPIEPRLYHRGWAAGAHFRNGHKYYGVELPLGPPYGGPLFFAHYSFLGLDPRGLRDRYADYWQQNVAHTRINYEHCVGNPNRCAGYGPTCWGLTASVNEEGYAAHAPDRDLCTIAPTAAVSSLPYLPDLVMPTIRHFHEDLGGRLWGDYGFVDAFSPATGWYSSEHLGIDQGPIVVMLENFRSGLLWEMFMSCPEIRGALVRLGFESPHLASSASREV